MLKVKTPPEQELPAGHKYVGVTQPGNEQTLPGGQMIGATAPSKGQTVPAEQAEQIEEVFPNEPGGQISAALTTPEAPEHENPNGQTTNSPNVDT